MKYIYLSPLFISLLLLLNIQESFSQCTPNKAYTAPGLYPDQMPDATVGQAYSQDITIVFFKDTTQSGITCVADEFDINGLAGLPPGITWQSNSSTDKFYPQTNLYGCVHFSGTPTVAGTYTLIASGNMKMSGNSLCPADNPVTYSVPFTVNAPSAANSGFTISAVSGCAPLNVDFTTSNNLTGNYTYLWEFGDALTTASTVKDPSFTYTDAGTYVIKQTATNIDPVKYILSSITIDAIPGSSVWEPFPEIDNPTWPLGGTSLPDVYINVYDANHKLLFGYDKNPSETSVYFHDQFDVTNTNAQSYPVDTNYQYLSAQTYTVEVYDLDPSNLGINDDDFLGKVSFYGNGPSTQSSDGSLKISFTINNTAVDPIVVTDTITVYPSPDLHLSASGAMEFCDGDSVTLISDQTTGNQWYGDTALIFGATSQNYTVSTSGSFYVIATNSYGCSDTSAKQNVVVDNNPPKPNFWYYNDTLWTSLVGYDLQWYLDGTAIYGANESYCAINATGAYSLVATSTAGCTTESTASNYTVATGGSSIQEITDIIQDINLYPNPSKGQFNVAFEISTPQDLSIAVEDVIGNSVLNIPLTDVHGKINQNIDLSHLAKGLYYVGINMNAQRIRKKMIIE